MQTNRALTVAACVAVLSVVSLGGAGQNPPAPAGGAQEQGRGASPAGRQGGGGARPNFPQQQRPLADPAVIARGQALYGVNCTSCHGADLRGGDQGGPNLLRSAVVLTDQKGENVFNVVRSGRQGPAGTMPAFHLPEQDVVAIAEYMHSVLARAGRQGRPPEGETPLELNVLVGDPEAGRTYFARVCGRCHSAAGDLQGIASRVPDPRALQNLWVAGRTGGGRGGDADDDGVLTTVTVTPAGSGPVSGRLVRIDEFTVTLVREDGTRRTFRREGAVPKVDIHDPLEPHRRLVLELGDRDMHNVTAYLATLK
jgi:cytochrome c oxidase cbb3-type subunit 3